MACKVIHLGRVEERLARYAAHIQASTAKIFVLFDDSSLEAELCASDSGDITAGT